MKLLKFVLAATLLTFSLHSEAARMGGGKSFGKQSSNVTQRSAPAVAPNQAAAAKPAAAPNAAATAPRKPWGAMLGGIAAGLGLAWLANSMGFGEEFGQFILIALAVFAVMMALGWFMRSRQGGSRAGAAGPLAYQGAGANASSPGGYSVENVGNDASARPWERNTTAFDAGRYEAPASGSMIGAGIRGLGNWSVPADFDAEGFVEAAKSNFVSMQAAWDRSDLAALRGMMTDDMLHEIRGQLATREAHSGGGVNNTEVVMIEGKLLGIEDLGNDYMASVEFSGMIREQPSSGPCSFREVWNMTKPKAGGGWLVAGVQALQ